MVDDSASKSDTEAHESNQDVVASWGRLAV